MSIIPASALTPCDLALLGNNMSSMRRRPTSPRRRDDLRAVNRSLAGHGERVGRLYGSSSRARTAPAA